MVSAVDRGDRIVLFYRDNEWDGAFIEFGIGKNGTT